MAEQTWLFRQGDLVLGPVPTKALVEKLFAGEVSGVTEVQLLGGGAFRPLKDVPELKVHWAKAEAKARVDAQAAELSRQRQKRSTAMLGVGAGVLLVVGGGVAVLGRYLAVYGAGGEDASGDITFETPVIAQARKESGEEFVDYQGAGKRAAAARPSGVPRQKMGAADSDGLAVGEVDQAGINAVIAKFKPTLIPCIREVARPGMPPTKIPIEFSVLETGKVGKVWVDNPEFKDGPLVECLAREMAKWPFKPQPSGATIQLAFNVGKKG
ncbi:MAG: hypothetical protein INH41_30580 [Myxococcaceae bacterium]|jgi:hypothetical protein|nr:hypothetical protein [Myxococcaceae bacterium]MCA3016752.1 hypothetical protein [Myxococcaceae bacterium]